MNEPQSIWARRQAWIAAGRPEGQEPRIDCPRSDCVGGRRLLDGVDVGDCDCCQGKGFLDGTEEG